jgi:hypothetical protein
MTASSKPCSAKGRAARSPAPGGREANWRDRRPQGPDTVVAAPDGRAAIAPPSFRLAGERRDRRRPGRIVAAMRASGLDAFAAACAGVWLHGRAASWPGRS